MRPPPLRFLLAIVVALSGCSEGADGVPAGPPKGRERALAATVCLEVIGRDAQGAFASHAAGTLLHEAGYVMTCEHVTVEGPHQQLRLADGRTFPYRIVARAGGSHDLALLAFEAPAGLEAMRLGEARALKPGSRVLLVGNPGGSELQQVEGILDRNDCGGGTQIQVRGAQVGPGYSGGPVIDPEGRQVALIHVAITTQPGLSRHVTIEHVRRAFQEVFQDPARHTDPLGLRVDCRGNAARITHVEADGPAARGGLRRGDVIRRVGAMPIRSGLHYVLARLDRVGADPVQVAFERKGRLRTLTVVPTPSGRR